MAPKLTHSIPLGTHVSFKGDSQVYEVCDYQTLLSCEPGCDWDHDCFEEPHICVRKVTTLSKPFSQLEFIFDAAGYGKEYKPCSPSSDTSSEESQ
jgi:hypothetical protein